MHDEPECQISHRHIEGVFYHWIDEGYTTSKTYNVNRVHLIPAHILYLPALFGFKLKLQSIVVNVVDLPLEEHELVPELLHIVFTCDLLAASCT